MTPDGRHERAELVRVGAEQERVTAGVAGRPPRHRRGDRQQDLPAAFVGFGDQRVIRCPVVLRRIGRVEGWAVKRDAWPGSAARRATRRRSSAKTRLTLRTRTRRASARGRRRHRSACAGGAWLSFLSGVASGPRPRRRGVRRCQREFRAKTRRRAAGLRSRSGTLLGRGSRGATAPAVEESARHRDRAEPPHGRPEQQSRLELGDQTLQLRALGRIEPVSTGGRASEQRGEPASLRGVETREMASGQHRHLPGQQQPSHRKPFGDFLQCDTADQRHAPHVTRAAVSRTGGSRSDRYSAGVPGDVAEWLRSGLQSRLHRFDSGRRLTRNPC
jgi:hypothetical protein